MIQTKLKGMGVALITPFKEDESVDYDALMRMVDYLLQNNADFLCVLGTTAETPTLTEEEKKTIKKMVIDRVNGRIPILLGVGGNNTRAPPVPSAVCVSFSTQSFPLSWRVQEPVQGLDAILPPFQSAWPE